MNILFFNTSDRTGGAAVAANRLMKALQKYRISVKMIVKEKRTKNQDVIPAGNTLIRKYALLFDFYWERLVIFMNNHFDRSKLFKVSIANTGVDITKKLPTSDIFHLHWVNQGFLSLNDIQRLTSKNKPVVWTMHDMWPCSSICHYSWGCDRFTRQCGKCPFLNSQSESDLSYKIYKKKEKLFQSKIYLVAVSSWLANQAKRSSLTKHLPIYVIPNVIDLNIYFPQNKQDIRSKLNLPLDKKIILMGAARLDDSIKGFHFLKEAIHQLLQRYTNLHLVLFGAIKDVDATLNDLNISYTWLGLLNDNSEIAELYSAADVTVVPSYYETFGQTLIEAMACKCPVVSFNNSGQTDIIDHKENGYLAKYKDVEDLANGIEWVLSCPDQEALKDNCINKVYACYTEEVVAQQYIELYNSITS